MTFGRVAATPLHLYTFTPLHLYTFTHLHPYTGDRRFALGGTVTEHQSNLTRSTRSSSPRFETMIRSPAESPSKISISATLALPVRIFRRVARSSSTIYASLPPPLSRNGPRATLSTSSRDSRCRTPLFACCVTLERESFDTRSNADEVQRWMARRRYTSLRLVTNDLHMPRARHEIRKRVGDEVTIVPDAVSTDPSFNQIFTEYNKYLLGRIADLIGI